MLVNQYFKVAFEEASTSASDDGLPIANHLYEGSLMDQGPSASFQGSQAAQGVTPSTRQDY